MNDNSSVDKSLHTVIEDNVELETDKTFLKLKTLLDERQVPYQLMEV